jgi:hypothetical protein
MSRNALAGQSNVFFSFLLASLMIREGRGDESDDYHPNFNVNEACRQQMAPFRGVLIFLHLS